MSLMIPSVIPGDWNRLRLIIDKLKHLRLGKGSDTIFASLTLSDLTASRLVATDADKLLVSSDLNSWVTGTANEVDITDDGDGTITIGIVNPLIVAKGGIGVATLTDHGILLGSGVNAVTPLGVAGNGYIPIGSAGADPVLALITGTANQIISTPGAGTVTLSTPQDIHAGATPTFKDLILSDFAGGGETIDEILDDIISEGILDAFTVTDANGIQITWSAGEVWDSANKTVAEVTAEATPQNCTDDAVNYLKWVTGTTLTLGTALPSGTDVLIASINCADGDIWEINQIPIISDIIGELAVAFQEIFPSLISSGLIVSEHAAGEAFDVDMTSGVYFNRVYGREAVSAQDSSIGNDLLITWYKSAAGEWTATVDQSEIDETQWNNGTTLAATGTPYWYRSLFFVTDDGINWVYPTAQYTTKAQAIAAPDPELPAGLTDHPKSTVLILQWSAAGLPAAAGDQWIDVRPIIGSTVSGDFSDHANLTSLAFASAGHTGFQAQGDVLDDLNTLGAAASDGQFIVATGAGAFAYEATTTARTSLGIGEGDSPTFAGITLSGNIIIPNTGWIGSVDTNQAIQIEADGDIVMPGMLAVTGDTQITGNVLLITDRGSVGYSDNSPMIVFDNSNNRVEFVGNIMLADDGTIGVADGTPSLTFDDTLGKITATGNFYVPSGALYSGADDTTRGYLHLYSTTTGYGGTIYQHVAADQDDTIEYYWLTPYEDDFIIGTDVDGDMLKFIAGTSIQSTVAFDVDAALTATTVDADTDFTVGDTVITDGVITDTTGLSLAANVSATGTITATGSFIIGGADMDETDLEKLDGITNGTAAANKCVVLGASLEIATIGTIGCGAITVAANSDIVTSGTGHITSGSEGFIVGNTTITDGSIEFGHASDTTLTRVSAGVIAVEGDNVVMISNSVDVLGDVDTTGAEAPSKNEVLKWNGTTWVPGEAGSTDEFTFSCTAFDDGLTTGILVGSGEWKAAEAITFTATYDNGPPTSADVLMSINGAAYNDVGHMDGAAYTSGKNYDGAINYPTVDQYLRFRLDSTDGEDPDIDYAAALYFYNYIWYGASATGAGFAEADVEALTSTISPSYTASRSINAGVNDYVVWAYPSRYTSIHASGAIFNSVTMPFTAPETVGLTNDAGNPLTENYKVFASVAKNLGNHTLVLSTTATLINPIYYGGSTKTTGWSEAEVKALTDVQTTVTNDVTATFTKVTLGASEYFVFAYPSRLTDPSNWYDHTTSFPLALNAASPDTVSITNVNGYTENYDVWSSENILGPGDFQLRTN